MIWLIIGIVLGWLLTNLGQGFAEARRYYHFDGELYKELTGHFKGHCIHQLSNTCQLNGVEFGECRFCPAVFAKAQDLRAVQYE